VSLLGTAAARPPPWRQGAAVGGPDFPVAGPEAFTGEPLSPESDALRYLSKNDTLRYRCQDGSAAMAAKPVAAAYRRLSFGFSIFMAKVLIGWI